MQWKGPDNVQRFRLYEGWDDLLRAGNMFALDYSLNRQAQDDWPDEKLPDYDATKVWTPDLFLEQSEREDLLAACELFRVGKVIEGMPRFRDYVRAREIRIFKELFMRYPDAVEFALSPNDLTVSQ